MKKILFLFLVLFGIFSCKKEQAIAQNQSVINERATKLDALYSELYQQGAFNGNVLVAENGKPIFQKSYGLANEETGAKLNERTTFELASVSKQFTAMGIVLLEKQAKLFYDDDISEYLPELKNYKGITIKNLLTHTGGLPDYMQLAEKHWDKTRIVTNQEIIKLFEKEEPEVLFEPNARWYYSNTGYLILASIIEKVSGLSYEDFLKQNIFDPLEMDQTFVFRRRYQPKELDNYAKGYIFSDSFNRKILPDELGTDHYTVYLDGIVG